jgi:hypothetical protein
MFQSFAFPQRLKPGSSWQLCGTTEVVPCYKAHLFPQPVQPPERLPCDDSNAIARGDKSVPVPAITRQTGRFDAEDCSYPSIAQRTQ